jgi:crossover junction endodeoxyribonuclease RuvC
MLAATDLEIRLVDYTPREIKQSITGNGSASKDQVEFMVKKIFKLNEGFSKKDISDAIAISWCALNRI